MDTQEQSSQRPTFLTVLCILSFISCGLGIIGGILLAVGSGALAAYIPGMGVGGMGFSILTLVLNIAFLYAVLQMWKQLKMGFYIYVGLQVVSVIAPLIFGIPFSVLGLIFPVLFIVLYYLNFKHMN